MINAKITILIISIIVSTFTNAQVSLSTTNEVTSYEFFENYFGFKLPEDVKTIAFTYENMPLQENYFQGKYLISKGDVEYFETNFKEYFGGNLEPIDSQLKHFFPEWKDLDEDDIVLKYMDFKEGKYAKTVCVISYIVNSDDEYYLCVLCPITQ